jgi:hypothetical protein
VRLELKVIMHYDGNFMVVILQYVTKNGPEGRSAAPLTERGRMLVPPTPARSLSQQNAQGWTRLYFTYVHPLCRYHRYKFCDVELLMLNSLQNVHRTTGVLYHVLCFWLYCRWMDANCAKQNSLCLSVSCVPFFHLFPVSAVVWSLYMTISERIMS